MNNKIKYFFILLLFSGVCVTQEHFFDPMRPMIKLPVINKSELFKINMIFYQGNTSKKNSKSWAIINSNQYFIGDTVQGRKLIDIKRGEVIFEYQGKQYKQRLVESGYLTKSKIDDSIDENFDDYKILE